MKPGKAGCTGVQKGSSGSHSVQSHYDTCLWLSLQVACFQTTSLRQSALGQGWQLTGAPSSAAVLLEAIKLGA